MAVAVTPYTQPGQRPHYGREKGKSFSSKILMDSARRQDPLPLAPCVVGHFSARQKRDASGLPGDDGVPATEGLRCSRGREGHAVSCSMELVCGILL